MIKCAKFKFNKKSIVFLFLGFFCGTPVHISRTNSVSWNVVWETLFFPIHGSHKPYACHRT